MSDPLPDPFADHPDWAPRPPRPIEIVPATGRVELRGSACWSACPDSAGAVTSAPTTG